MRTNNYRFRKLFILWIWATFFLPMLVWPGSDPIRAEDQSPPPGLAQAAKNAQARVTEALDTALEEERRTPDKDKNPYPPTSEFQNLEEALQKLEGVSESDSRIFASEITRLYLDLLSHAESEMSRLGREEFDRLANEGKIKIRNSTGVAELNLVDGHFFYRIVHAESEISFRWMNLAECHIDSLHNRQIIANQHVAAGRSRVDGQRGRDDIEIWFRPSPIGPVIESIKFYARPNPGTTLWWRDQVLATWSPPTVKTFAFGVFWGVVQATQVALMNELNHAYFHRPDPTHGQWAFTLFWGAVCGTFATFLRKFNQIGSDQEMIVRNILTTGLPFYIPFALLDPAKGPHVLLEPYFYFQMALYFVVNNLSKIELQKIVKARTDERLNIGQFLGNKRQDWEYQGIMNLVLFPFRLLNLTDSLVIRIESLQTKIAGGQIAFLAIYPPLKFANVLYKESLGTDDALKERIAWEKHPFAMLFGVPVGTAADLGLLMITPFGEKGRARWTKMIERLDRQKWALPYHMGNLVDGLGSILEIVDETPEKKQPHRFARVNPTWSEAHPLEKSSFSKGIGALKSMMQYGARSAKNVANHYTVGGLQDCALRLRELGKRMKKPFEDRLAAYAAQHPSKRR